MGTILDEAQTVYADGPSGSPTEPAKSLIRHLFATVDTRVDAALAGAGEIVGTWDASSGTFPGAGAADTGAAYLVTVAGTTGGVTFRVGDRIISITTNSSTSTYAGNWLRLAGNLDPVVDATDSGAGTANAIQVVATEPVSSTGGQLIAFEVFEANTSGTVTLQITDGVGAVISGLAVKTASGADPAIGALSEGLPVIGRIDGSTFRLFSEQTLAAWAAKVPPSGVVVGTTDTQTLTNKTIGDELTLNEGGTIYEMETLDGAGIVILDVNGKLIARIGDGDSQEIVEARGDRGTMDQRLSVSMNDYGAPALPIWGAWYLRETRMRLRKLTPRTGYTPSGQLCIAMIGDSYTHDSTHYTGPFAETLIEDYGDAGCGWIGFGNNGGALPNGNVRPSSYTYAKSGTWNIDTYMGTTGPDMGQISSSSAGAKVTLTGAALPVLSSADLHWVATADGVVRYRWNGGSWTSMNVQGTLDSAQQGNMNTNLPASGAWTLEIEVVSGSVVLCGVDMKSAAAVGVVVHKLGSTGSRASQWAAVTGADWQSGLADLAPHLVTIMLACNDQSDARTMAQYRSDLLTIIANIRAAIASIDILIVMQPENQRTTNTYPMSDYAVTAYQVAVEQGCAYGDSQYVFGDDPADYADGSARPWFGPDLIHMEPTTGGVAMTDFWLHIIDNA